MNRFLASAKFNSAGLGPRQIRVIASDATLDRAGDVMLPSGCVTDNFKRNPIVLADHDHRAPIGTAEISISSSAVAALITFAPEGVSAKADEYCALAKAGILGAVSVGFIALERTPNRDGGYLISRWELCELSIVAVPCNPAALVTGKSFRKSGRVLSASNVALVTALQSRLAKGEKCEEKALALIEKARGHHAAAQGHAVALAASAFGDDDDDPDDDQDNPNEELALAAGARRRRDLDILAMALPPDPIEQHLELSPADARRRRDLEILKMATN